MGLRGPAPLSKKKLERRGSWRAADRPDDLELPVETPEPPDSLTGEARAEWDRLVALMSPMQVLSKGDRAALTMLCELWAEYRELGVVLDRAETGTPKWKRVYSARNEVRRQLRDMLSRFGLTPADRARVKVGEQKGKDAEGNSDRDAALRLIG